MMSIHRAGAPHEQQALSKDLNISHDYNIGVNVTVNTFIISWLIHIFVNQQIAIFTFHKTDIKKVALKTAQSFLPTML